MAITFSCDGVKFPKEIKRKDLTLWIRSVAASHGFKVGELGYLLCTDEKILEINKEYLQHDYYTDIITFDYTENGVISGDIFMSMETVASNADQFSVTLTREFLRIVIHGVLHLCGFPDKSPQERAEMTRLEDEALALVSFV